MMYLMKKDLYKIKNILYDILQKRTIVREMVRCKT